MVMNACGEQEFIRDYSKAIKENGAALFIGSGLSRAAGYADWKGILKEAATDIGLSVEKESDLISLAEYYVNNKGRAKINTTISKYFSQKIPSTETHRILATLPIKSYWTTNYDKLLERTFDEMEVPYSFLTDDDSFKKYIIGEGILLHKLHGDVDTPSEAVITKKDYEEFAYKHEILLAKLKGEMCSKSFLFLGYGFQDTDIKHILTRIRLFYKDDPAKRHYCIVEKLSREENESEEDFAYRERKQEHHIVDLKSYGIHTVLVDNYSTDILRLLKAIRGKVYAQNVYISGACEDGDEFYKLSMQFAKTLSSWLITKNCKIYSGYGKNIGAEVVVGANDGCRLMNRGLPKLHENVFIFPFPYKKSMEVKERKELYSSLRNKIISRTGICLIINGSKSDDGKTVISEGVLDEAKIAVGEDCLVVPIAITGGAAKQIWEKMHSWNNDYTNSVDFQNLNSVAGYDAAYKAVQSIINRHIESLSE